MFEYKNYLIILLIGFFTSCTVNKKYTSNNSQNIEIKYAKLLNVDRKDISNKKLYSFIENWYGVKYKFGGKTKEGIDCSGLVSILNNEVYGKTINGNSSSLYQQCKKLTQEELKEGDLVFFKINSEDVSHIGIYLQNKKFVHASTKAGVIINDLNEEYYKKYYAGSGRLK